MAEHWVVNASPLIVLARIRQEALLLSLAEQVVVPRAVAVEIEAGPSQDEARQALDSGRFTIVDTPPPPPELLAWDLGSGETAVLSLAMTEKKWTAILDDAAARRCAHGFSVSLKGTLAVVLLARQRDLVPSAAGVMQALIGVGFRIDKDLLIKTLAQTVGESWPPESR